MFGKYSFNNLIKIYSENKQIFNAYLDNHSVEGIDDKSSDVIMCTKLEDIPLSTVVLLIIMHFILFIWAVFIILYRWKIMPEWAKSVSIICLILNYPLFSIISVYISTNKK